MLALLVFQIAWPAALAGIAGLSIAYFWSVDNAKRSSALMMGAAFIGPALMLIWATAASDTGNGIAATEPSWQIMIHWVLTGLSVCAILGIAWRIRQQPRAWLFGPIAVAAAALIAVVWFLGTMAITGDWI